jgi:hypothetical protein
MIEVENPGTKKVESLLEDIADGSYVIPYFQRGFEWEPRMVAELFESIQQQYYTGLLLFWELDDERAEQQEWDPIWGAERSASPKMAVLDGQQRLSSLYYAVYNPEKKFPNRKSYYVFYADPIRILNEEYENAITYKFYRNYRGWDELKDLDAWISKSEIPLPLLTQTDPDNSDARYIHSREFDEWIEQFLAERSDEIPPLKNRYDVQKIFQKMLDYTFVIYPLDASRNIQDICNIFAKVNASGMKLSTFDLINAFMYPSGVELRKSLWEGLGHEELKRVDSNMAEHLLKVISLHKQNYCSSQYLYNLIPGEKTIREDTRGDRYEEILVKTGEEFEKLWAMAIKHGEQARQLMMNTGHHQFGAIRTEFIPHGTIFPVLAATLWEFDDQVSEEEFKQQVRRWYWSAVFSQDYTGSADTMMGRDFRDWKRWLMHREPMEQLQKVDSGFISEMNLLSESKGSGRYNAVICLIALNGAEDFYNGSIIGTGDFSGTKINDHHIFPKNVSDLPDESAKGFAMYRDSIANRTLIFNETNQKISKTPPSVYLEEMERAHGGAAAVRSLLEKHLISDTAYQYLKNDDFDNFVMEREDTIRRHIAQTIGLDIERR